MRWGVRGEACFFPPTASEGLPARLSTMEVCRIAEQSGDVFLRVLCLVQGVFKVRHVYYWRSVTAPHPMETLGEASCFSNPASAYRGLTGLHRLWRDLPAQDGQSFRPHFAYAFLLDIETGIEITIMVRSALRTRPFTHGKRQVRKLVPAV